MRCSLEADAFMPPEAAVSGADTVAAEFTDMVVEVTDITAEITDISAEMTTEIVASGATAPARGLVRSGSARNR
jgi:hypothetical protein